MTSLRNVLLSCLLFVFGFFIVHDYVIADVDADTQYELCYAQSDTAVLDLPSQIHEHIHILLSVPEAEIRLAGSTPLHARIGSTFDPLQSHITPVRPRPPLI